MKTWPRITLIRQPDARWIWELHRCTEDGSGPAKVELLGMCQEGWMEPTLAAGDAEEYLATLEDAAQAPSEPPQPSAAASDTHPTDPTPAPGSVHPETAPITLPTPIWDRIEHYQAAHGGLGLSVAVEALVLAGLGAVIPCGENKC